METRRCEACGCVIPQAGFKEAQAVLAAIAKLDKKFERAKLCQALRWVADYIDVRDTNETDSEDVRKVSSE